MSLAHDATERVSDGSATRQTGEPPRAQGDGSIALGRRTGPAASMAPVDLELDKSVRESIRGLLESGDDQLRSGAELEPLRELADTHRPRVTVGDGGVLGLENPRHDNLGDGLFDLLLIIRRAQQDGSWSHLKVCANPDCRWAFYDRSRNQQGSWCNMAVCGNRLKNRQLRARRR